MPSVKQDPADNGIIVSYIPREHQQFLTHSDYFAIRALVTAQPHPLMIQAIKFVRLAYPELDLFNARQIVETVRAES